MQFNAHILPIFSEGEIIEIQISNFNHHFHVIAHLPRH
jgi:hypothetical protein